MNKIDFARQVLQYMTRLDIKLGLNDVHDLMGLLSAYFEPHRKYHNWAHILEGLEEIAKSSQVLRLSRLEKQLLFLMWVFHDIAYEPDAINNEIRSACQCCDFVKQALDESDILFILHRVLHGVLATDHDGPPSDDPLIQILCDVDLVRLAAPPDQFVRNTADIRLEYALVDDEAFRRDRVKILGGFLDRNRRPSVYLTDYFKKRYEAQARANLTRALAELGVPP